MNDPVLDDLHNAESQSMVGTIIANRYEIVSKLGSGGFAVVYRAFDRDIERDVAIKVLNLDLLSGNDQSRDSMLERFRREARLAARIRHPNVVEIYDLGELNNKSHPYIIMEILEGHDLDDELRIQKGFEPTRAIPLFCGALDALAEAHRKGIIHKDIKPANLFLNHPNTRQESLKVVDFGIAHIGGTLDTRLTQTGMMFGTPQYLPPEYIEKQIVTPAMDVYQMALVLVEMLTGTAVVDAETPWQCAMKHVMRSFSLPEPLLASPLGPILIRAIEADHTIRYSDAAAFVEALLKINPADIPDVRGSDVPSRSFNVTSGQWVPTVESAIPPVQIQSMNNAHPHTQISATPQKSPAVLLIGIFAGLLILISTALVVLFALMPQEDSSPASANISPDPEIITQPVDIAVNDNAAAQAKSQPPSQPMPANEPEMKEPETINPTEQPGTSEPHADSKQTAAPEKAKKPVKANPVKPISPKKPAEPKPRSMELAP